MKIKTMTASIYAALACATLAAAATTVTVNGRDEATIPMGAPAIVCVTSIDTTGIVNPNFTLQAYGPGGTPLDLALELKRKTDPELLDGIASQTAVWTIAADDLAKLPDGMYQVASPDGKRASFRIDRSAAPDQLQASLLMSECAELDGRLDDALARANDAVALAPESVSGWLRKADVLTAQGNLESALDALTTAENVALKTHVKRPPVTITARQRAIEQLLP